MSEKLIQLSFTKVYEIIVFLDIEANDNLEVHGSRAIWWMHQTFPAKFLLGSQTLLSYVVMIT